MLKIFEINYKIRKKTRRLLSIQIGRITFIIIHHEGDTNSCQTYSSNELYKYPVDVHDLDCILSTSIDRNNLKTCIKYMGNVPSEY